MLVSPYPYPDILPPAHKHPRLLITAEEMPRVRANFADPENAVFVERFSELLEMEVTGKGADPETKGSYDLVEYLAVEAKALDALLSGDRRKKRAVIDTLLMILRTVVYKGNMMDARWGGHAVFISAEVYDWCYDELTDEEKTEITERCEDIAHDTFEMKYPPNDQSSLSGHGTEAQLLRDLLAFSVATYDERPDIYEYCAGRILSEYRQSFSQLYAGDAHPQGPSYGSYRFTILCWSELIFRIMGYSVFDNIERTAEWLWYVKKPDGAAINLGDDFLAGKDAQLQKDSFVVPLFCSYALTGRTDFKFLDKYSRVEVHAHRHRGIDFYKLADFGEALMSQTAVLLFDHFTPDRDPVAAEKPKPCRHFGSPVGMTVYKKGDVYVIAKMSELWAGNHDHLDTGHFLMYAGVPLITEHGTYIGTDYLGDHRQSYLIRTAAHNCLTVERPDKNMFGEDRWSKSYDGGTRFPCRGDEPQNTAEWNDGYRMAKITCHEESDSGFVLEGDMTEAYVHSCKKAVRRMEFSADEDGKGGKMTVTDTVTALDSSFRKGFNIQCVTEPEISGNTVTIRNEGAKVTCRVLSPENYTIEAIGGDGKRFFIGGTDHEPENESAKKAGWGRVVIRPKEQRETDVIKVELSMRASE